MHQGRLRLLHELLPHPGEFMFLVKFFLRFSQVISQHCTLISHLPLLDRFEGIRYPACLNQAEVYYFADLAAKLNLASQGSLKTTKVIS